MHAPATYCPNCRCRVRESAPETWSGDEEWHEAGECVEGAA